MAMSNLYSKISTKPMKRFQDNVTVKQTNAWMNGERNKNRVKKKKEKTESCFHLMCVRMSESVLFILCTCFIRMKNLAYDYQNLYGICWKSVFIKKILLFNITKTRVGEDRDTMSHRVPWVIDCLG